MKYIPLFNHILVEPIKSESFLEGEQKPIEEKGTVIAIGKEVKHVKVGDVLLFNSWGVSKTSKTDEVVYYVIPEDKEFILCKIDESSTQ